jgi:hypothetical protein
MGPAAFYAGDDAHPYMLKYIEGLREAYADRTDVKMKIGVERRCCLKTREINSRKK